MQYLKDNNNKNIGTISTNGNNTYVRDFKSNRIVSSYNSSTNRTTDWKSGRTNPGNTSIRHLK